MSEELSANKRSTVAKGAVRKRLRDMKPWRIFLYRLANLDTWNLKGRFVYLTGAMLVLGSVVQIGLLSHSLNQSIINGADTYLQLCENNLLDAIQARQELLLSQTSVAAGYATVVDALVNRNREALLEFGKSYSDKVGLYLNLSTLNLSFLVPPGVAIAQTAYAGLLKADYSKDFLRRSLFETGAAFYGVARDSRGVELQAMSPVERDGVILGAVGASLPLGEVLEGRVPADVSMVLLLHADSARHVPGQGKPGTEGAGGGKVADSLSQARTYGNWLVMRGYGKRWRDSLGLLENGDVRETLDGLNGRLVPLKDARGILTGAILLSIDTTSQFEAKENRVYQLGGLFVSGAMLLWAILFFNTRRIEMFLRRLKRIIIASHASNFNEQFESDHVHCLEVMHCHNEECPVFMDPTRICYLETGSEAISPLWKDTCIFLNQYDSCQACPVYIVRKGDELTEMRNLINTMTRHWQAFLSRSGHLLAYVLRSQETSGHIPSLDEVAKRLEQMAKLTFYGHDLQGTLDKAEVYQQLANVFKKDFHLSTFVLFELDPDTDRVAIALDQGREVPLCKQEVLLSAEVCRANRVAEDVSSYYNPVLCPYFNCDLDKYVRCCLPMVMGGYVGAVFSFLAPRSQWETVRSEMIPVLRKYLDATAPVLSSLKLLKLTQEQALRDPLTHCHNRRFLDEFISKYEPQSERDGRRTGLLMADLDYFKQVNDEHGHEAGDQVLKQVVNIINESIRRSDLLIRYGGEEFLVMLQDVQDSMAEQVAEKIRARIQQHAFEVGAGAKIYKTISIGVAEYPTDGDTMYKAIKFTDVALYEAKNQGRNLVIRFKPEMWQVEEY